jgi:quercetin dioxygenase-like cupin family protein
LWAEDNKKMLDVATEWTTGRAGMLYRDLTPARFKDQVIVSHIRLPFDGEVPDYVHYHKVEFQVIYCIRGRIRVVYEDQGPPFWLEPGDLVLQPPEIRHRVLECEANSEVVELTMPPGHETRADRNLTLPTGELKPGRIFGTQPFVRLKAVNMGQNAANFAELLERVFENADISGSIRATIHSVMPLIQRNIPSDRLPDAN